MKTCSIPDCKNSYYSKSFCKVHYDKNRRHGDPLFVEVIAKGTPCPIDGCGKPVWANGMCAMHDRRKKRHGDPNFVNPKCNRDGNYKNRALKKSAAWKRANPKENNAFNTARKRQIKLASLGDAKSNDVTEFYSSCPDMMQVDHIIPINHDEVCGLHVPWNMQYLTQRENAIKSNKFDGTYENNTWRKFI
jgi:5-methylcytosine-specific restriction endonuclease McrA